MAFPGRTSVAGCSPLSAPTSASFPPSDAPCWPSSPTKGCCLAQLAEFWAGKAGRMRVWPLPEHVPLLPSKSPSSETRASSGPAPRMPQASSPAEYKISNNNNNNIQQHLRRCYFLNALIFIISLSPHSDPGLLLPTIWYRGGKPRLRRVNRLAQGHMANGW